MAPTFQYATLPVKELKVETSKGKRGKTTPTTVVIDQLGVKCNVTKRFWASLRQRFRLSDNIFNLFTPEEVFERIQTRHVNDQVRVCLESTVSPAGETINKLQGCTNPGKPIIAFDVLNGLLDQYSSLKADYADGVVRSIHLPRANSLPFDIAGDKFENRYVIDTPIDGYGKPNVYLSMLRQVCSNGAIAYAPMFRSEINVGKKNDSIEFSLARALEGFNNEEGFIALRERFEASTKSWASVNEAMALSDTVLKLYQQGHFPGLKKIVIGTENDVSHNENPIFSQLNRVTSELNTHYGLSDLNALSAKQQRVLPSSAKVYDLLNFASELATHNATTHGSRVLQSFVGDRVSLEYDLENTATKYDDWKDFFINNEETINVMSQKDRLFN